MAGIYRTLYPHHGLHIKIIILSDRYCTWVFCKCKKALLYKTNKIVLHNARLRPSPPGTFHILIEKFSYFAIRFLLNSSIVKSDNEIGKVNGKKIYDLKI